MLKVAICDDDREYQIWLEEEIDHVFGKGTEVLLYSSGEDLLVDSDIMHEVILLDVDMPGIDGIETAVRIRKENRTALLIFISGVRNPTPESFKVSPYRYLLKSYGKEKMEMELSDIYQEANRIFTDEYLVCERDGYVVRIKLMDILYVSIIRGGSQVHVYGENGEDCLFVREKIRILGTSLLKFDFAFAHNSYLVNLRYVDSYSRTEVVLKDKTILAISRSKYSEFEERIFQYWGRKYV